MLKMIIFIGDLQLDLYSSNWSYSQRHQTRSKSGIQMYSAMKNCRSLTRGQPCPGSADHWGSPDFEIMAIFER